VDTLARAFAGLIVLENVSSLQLMGGALPVCPLCGGGLQPTYWRAGLEAFVAAAKCAICGCQLRANDAFSIAGETNERNIFAGRCRKEADKCISITSLINFRIPKTVVPAVIIYSSRCLYEFILKELGILAC
jgi:hypothetical protein